MTADSGIMGLIDWRCLEHRLCRLLLIEKCWFFDESDSFPSKHCCLYWYCVFCVMSVIVVVFAVEQFVGIFIFEHIPFK